MALLLWEQKLVWWMRWEKGNWQSLCCIASFSFIWCAVLLIFSMKKWSHPKYVWHMPIYMAIQLRDHVECVLVGWWGLFKGTRCLCLFVVDSQILGRDLEWFLFSLHWKSKCQFMRQWKDSVWSAGWICTQFSSLSYLTCPCHI